eukprot:318599-Rhodomonas_salina.1
MQWQAEQEIVAAEQRTKKEVALVKQVADHIHKASQALYKMQASESCLPYCRTRPRSVQSMSSSSNVQGELKFTLFTGLA